MPVFYGTVLDADAYHLARGTDTEWDDIEDKEAALLRASEWVDRNYRSRFAGYKLLGRSQEREWPRYDAYDAANIYIPSDEVPVEVEYATYEAALKEGTTPGTLSPDYDPPIARLKADVVEIEYAGTSQATEFTTISGILSNVLVGGGSGKFTMRAVRT